MACHMTMDSSKLNKETEPSYIQRIVDLPALLNGKSCFLFGPRQTGRTFLFRHTLRDARIYDLLDSTVYLSLSQHPGRLAQEITSKESINTHTLPWTTFHRISTSFLDCVSSPKRRTQK